MDDWGIDVILTAAQKCFGAPPGLAICVFSERAMAKRKSLPSIPAYYSDILRWLPIMKDPIEIFLDALRQRDPGLRRSDAK